MYCDDSITVICSLNIFINLFHMASFFVNTQLFLHFVQIECVR